MESLWVLLPTGQRASAEWIDDTLRARVEEKGLLARTPRAGEFPRQRVERIRDADPGAPVDRLYRERGPPAVPGDPRDRGAGGLGGPPRGRAGPPS